jgi:hypothetical protein
LGLLSATIVAGVLALLLPAFTERLSAPEALPQPDIITQFRGATFDEGPSELKLPKPQLPPAHLLNPYPDPESAVASNYRLHSRMP